MLQGNMTPRAALDFLTEYVDRHAELDRALSHLNGKTPHYRKKQSGKAASFTSGGVLLVLGKGPMQAADIASSLGDASPAGKKKLSVMLARLKKDGAVARRGHSWRLTSKPAQ